MKKSELSNEKDTPSIARIKAKTVYKITVYNQRIAALRSQ